MCRRQHGTLQPSPDHAHVLSVATDASRGFLSLSRMRALPLLYALKSGAEQATSIFFVAAATVTQMRACTYPHLQDIPSFSLSHIHTFFLSLSLLRVPPRDLQITIKILNVFLFFSFLFYQAQLLGSEAVFFSIHDH